MKDENATAGESGDTLDMVRRMIDEAGPAPAPEAAPESVRKVPDATAPARAPVVQQPRPMVEQPMTRPVEPVVAPREKHVFEELLDQEDCSERSDSAMTWRQRAFAAARAFLQRPEATRELALAFLAISAIVWPGYVAAMAVLSVLAAVITWLTLGPDESAERIVAWHARLAERDPEKAETIRRRAARVSRAITRAVDRLPDHWTTGFVLPDFEPAQDAPEKLQDDPFARLAAEVRSGESVGSSA